MQDQPANIVELVRVLRHFGARPALYIKPVNVQNAQSHLNGVDLCLQILVRPLRREDFDGAYADRGWERGKDVEQQMRQRGMSDAEIHAIFIERQFKDLLR
jgi:hypothetical protein